MLSVVTVVVVVVVVVVIIVWFISSCNVVDRQQASFEVSLSSLSRLDWNISRLFIVFLLVPHTVTNYTYLYTYCIDFRLRPNI